MQQLVGHSTAARVVLRPPLEGRRRPLEGDSSSPLLAQLEERLRSSPLQPLAVQEHSSLSSLQEHSDQLSRCRWGRCGP